MNNVTTTQKDSLGRTPLMHAVLQGKDTEVKQLIKSGVDINVQDNNGFSALHFAAQDNQLASLRLLVEAGALIDTPNKFGNTPLFIATFNSKGRGEIIQLLLKNGADRDYKNKSGVSPIDLAHTTENYNVKQFFNKY